MALTFVKPRGGEGQNGRLKCPLGFLVLIHIGSYGQASFRCQFLLLLLLFCSVLAKPKHVVTFTLPCINTDEQVGTVPSQKHITINCNKFLSNDESNPTPILYFVWVRRNRA